MLKGKSLNIARSVKLLVLALCFSVLAACAGHGKPDRHLDHFMGYIAYRLDFDDSQKEILDRLQAEIVAIKKESKAGRVEHKEAFNELLMADTLDTGRVQQMVEEHQQQSVQQLPRLLPLLAELHLTLTDEQKTKIQKGMKHWDRRK